MSNVNVKVETSGNELTIREGKARELQNPVKISLSGDINSIDAFLSKRYGGDNNSYSLQEVDKTKTVVIVDKQNLLIVLLLDPENVFGTTVKGSLQFTPEFKQWGINSNQEFNRESLIKLIRFNRRFFKDALKHEELLKAYQTLSISTQGDLKQNSDTRGNKSVAFDKKVNSENIPTEFILSVPIFKGYQAETFRVEICLDATDASVRFWFESVELAELIQKRTDEIFDAQLKGCQDFVIIQQ